MMQTTFKRLLVGFGIMFGVQFLASYLGFRISEANRNDSNTTFYIMLGFTLAAYFGGGLSMGLLSTRIYILEPIFASLVSIVMNAVFSIFNNRFDLLLTRYAIEKNDWIGLLIAVGAAVFVALIGAMIGERIVVPTDDWLNTLATIIGLVSLVIGPIFLLSQAGTEKGLPGLPSYILLIILLLFLLVVAIGYILFTRELHDAEDISISPERKDLI